MQFVHLNPSPQANLIRLDSLLRKNNSNPATNLEETFASQEYKAATD
jgi:hypothetical protein